MHMRLVKAESAKNQSEIDAAWAIYCALVQFRAVNQVLFELADFNKAVFEAHEKWAGLFAK